MPRRPFFPLPSWTTLPSFAPPPRARHDPYGQRLPHGDGGGQGGNDING